LYTNIEIELKINKGKANGISENRIPHGIRIKTLLNAHKNNRAK